MIHLRRISLRYSLLSICVSSCRAMSTSTSRKAIAAIAQLRSTSSKYQNLLDVAKCARLAKSQGASMLFLPECFGFIGESSEQTLQNAEEPVMEDTRENQAAVSDALRLTISREEDLSHPLPKDRDPIFILDGLKTIARESGLWISGGGMHVGAPADEVTGRARVYNTHVIVDDSGTVRCLYRKIHLFDVSIPGKITLQESATTAPGDKLVVCDSPVGKLGLSTCYDMRFPEMYAPLVQKGAQILLMPSAFTVPTGQAHWHTLLRARAIESQCYVLAAAQYGRHNIKRESFGHSLAVDPWGKIVADAGGYGADDSFPSEPDEPPSIVTCEIDLELLESIRQRMPLDLHRSSASFSF